MQGKRLSLEELWSTGTAQDVANYLAQLEENKHEAPKFAPIHLQEMKQEANGDSKPAALDVETSKKGEPTQTIIKRSNNQGQG